MNEVGTHRENSNDKGLESMTEIPDFQLLGCPKFVDQWVKTYNPNIPHV